MSPSELPTIDSLQRLVSYPLSNLLGLSELKQTYAKLEPARLGCHFFERALHALDVRIEAAPEEIENIPASGPVIIVANHPFGALDGLVAGALAARRHSQVKVMANQWLGVVPELRPWLLSVDVFGARAARNASILRGALTHLRQAGLLILFPAGVVSHFQPASAGVVDPHWNRLAATLARKTQATVIPMYFAGNNSLAFQVAGLIHPLLRTALLPREMLRRRSTTVQVRVGKALSSHAIAALNDDAALTQWFRLRTYDLARPANATHPKRHLVPIRRAMPATLLESEITSLPSECLLVDQGRFRAYVARANQIPRILLEIGRLREVTFRAVGEGTGESVDLDRFDAHYRHLFVYDGAESRIVGAYRLGLCDELLLREGPSGLYTNTLFKFEGRFVRSLDDTIELGRSFVCAEYQRSPLALALLWRGIGEVLSRNPRYARLMGPVSISGSYSRSARRLIVSYLENLEKECGNHRQVRARRPPRDRFPAGEVLSRNSNVRLLSRLVAELDSDKRGIPVLLERYLELGGQVLGLNVDPKFGNCVDALIVVDVPRAPRTMLRRFLGEEGLSRYLDARHGRIGLSA